MFSSRRMGSAALAAAALGLMLAGSSPAQQAKPLKTLDARKSRGADSVAFHPDGKLLAAGNGDGSVVFWDVATGKIRGQLKAHTDSVNGVAFSADGKHLVTASWDRSMRVWDTATGTEVRILIIREGNERFVQLAATPDGGRVAGRTGNYPTFLFDSATGKQLGQLNAGGGMAFTPDGKLLVTAGGSGRGNVLVWDVDANARKAAYNRKEGINAMALSPDGKVLALASDNARNPTVELVEPLTGKEISILKGSPSLVRALAFSPNGKLLGAATNDESLLLWDAQTGAAKAAVKKAHTLVIRSIAFSPDGKLLASWGNDDTIRLWPVPQR